MLKDLIGDKDIIAAGSDIGRFEKRIVNREAMTAQRWNQALVDLQAIRSSASISCCKQQMPHIASNI